jgi:serine/threonine protein kinase
VWAAVSPDAKDMIKKLLLVDPRQRLTVGDVLSHPWCRAKAPGRQELLKTMTRMRSSKMRLHVPPPEPAAERMAPVMEGAKSGTALDLEEESIMEELAAEHAAELEK